MLKRVKQSVRIKSNAFDDELSEMIESAKLDLSIAGVQLLNEDDALIQRAIIIYCKANFGLDNKDSEKYQKAFDNLKERLSLCGDYHVDE